MHWEKNIVRPNFMNMQVATVDGWVMMKRRSWFTPGKHSKETFGSAVIAGVSVLASMVASAITHLHQFPH
jgi:hypothetical protein